MIITISNFVQGGFYVDSGEEYDSSTEIRSEWIELVQPQKITVLTDKQWSFVCENKSGFVTLSESLGYKDGNTTIDLSHIPNIQRIRIELHDDNGISLFESCVLQADYYWNVSSVGLLNTEFIEVPLKPIEKPYPSALWCIEKEEYPTNGLLVVPELLGAFANATNLKEVSIPKSVKKIGRYSFRNTRLKSVTIARDCEYFDTSFPDECIVNFY